MDLFSKFLVVLGGLAFLVLVSFLLSWPVYMLWNGCLVDAVNSIKEVTWLQSWGITVLCSLLFKSNTSNSK
jgi:hypothetical protein